VHDCSMLHATGTLPRCMAGSSRIQSLRGTHLSASLLPSDNKDASSGQRDPTSAGGSSGSGGGGACDATPPDCDADVGCV
jgi:hypothetical protein